MIERTVTPEPTPSTNAGPCLACGRPLPETQLDYFDTRFGQSSFYGIATCTACGLEQTVPRPGADELTNLYQTYYNFTGDTPASYTATRQRFFSSRGYAVWLLLDGDIAFHSRRGKGRLLEIGCNEGRNLWFYHKHGYEAEGLEINENAIAAARKQGFVVHALPLDRYQPQVPYDVAVLSNVLEHSLDFQKMLHDIVRLLSAQGQLWISCPNSRSWMRPVFRRHWINWHVPFHIAHFNPLFLSEVLKNKGFRVKEFRCETPALWVAQSIIAWVFAKRGKPTRQLRSPVWVTGLILLVRCVFFPFLWLGNRLGRGDCLVIIAQKLA